MNFQQKGYYQQTTTYKLCTIKMKYLLILFLSPLVLGGLDIFGGSSGGSNVDPPPEGCAYALGGRCIRCLSAYELDGNGCKKKWDQIPCDGKIPCDDAQLVEINPQAKNNQQDDSRLSDPTPAQRVAIIDHHGTNNQEDNVDESDILKTDGHYIYTISRRIFSITRSYPLEKIQLLHNQTFNAFYPRGLFIEGNFVTIFGSKDASHTIIQVYNVENKSDPKLIKTYEVEGWYFDGRKVSSGFVYIVSEMIQTQERYAELKVNNVSENISNLTQTKQCIGNQTLYYVNVLGFNLTNPDEYNAISARTIAIDFLYMSEDNIFLVENRNEKLGDSYAFYSFIQKIFVKNHTIVHHACQKVQGKILNQFSMDEFEEDGILRVATTHILNWANPVDNRVYCLNRKLQVVSSLTGIAPTEKIYSARYSGSRLYLVTFREIDPFFVIEFDAHHLNPKILGEVKITGYSNYLHLYDETTIIGIGKEVVEDNGRLVTNGVKFSIFNVSDPSNPIVADTDHLTDPKITSLALQDHKAFFFSKQHDLMIFPASLNDKNNLFNGVLVFEVSPTSIKFRTLIDHILSAADDNFSDRSVERILYVEELLFTKSRCLLKVNNIQTFTSQKILTLPCD